jgi:hypothetical protein
MTHLLTDNQITLVVGNHSNPFHEKYIAIADAEHQAMIDAGWVSGVEHLGTASALERMTKNYRIVATQIFERLEKMIPEMCFYYGESTRSPNDCPEYQSLKAEFVKETPNA